MKSFVIREPLIIFFVNVPFFTSTGSTACAANFQVYLLEGITRWNANRYADAQGVNREHALRCYDTKLLNEVDTLSKAVLPSYTLPIDVVVPGQYTG